jgi:hypothetical protein
MAKLMPQNKLMLNKLMPLTNVMAQNKLASNAQQPQKKHRHHRGRYGYGRRWPWLYGGAPVTGPISSSMVAWAQSCLGQLLGSSVPQDGILGPNTRQAIVQFQSQQQLPTTGVLDSNTVNALQAACSAQPAPPAERPGLAAGGAPPGPPALPPPPDQGGESEHEASIKDAVKTNVPSPFFIGAGRGTIASVRAPSIAPGGRWFRQGDRIILTGVPPFMPLP